MGRKLEDRKRVGVVCGKEVGEDRKRVGVGRKLEEMGREMEWGRWRRWEGR